MLAPDAPICSYLHFTEPLEVVYTKIRLLEPKRPEKCHLECVMPRSRSRGNRAQDFVGLLEYKSLPVNSQSSVGLPFSRRSYLTNVCFLSCANGFIMFSIGDGQRALCLKKKT